MADAPALPDSAPIELREFIACKRASVTIASGPLTWLPLPPELREWGPTPGLGLEPGPTPGSGTITIDLGLMTLRLPVSIVGGELAIDASGLPAILPGAGDLIDAWTKQFNDWLKANGQRLKPASIKEGTVTLVKEPIPPAAPPGGGGATGGTPANPPTPPSPPTGGSVTTPGTGAAGSGGAGPGGCALWLLGLVLLLGVGLVVGVGTGVIRLPGDPGAPSTGAPSTTAPSTGAPSTGAPSTGAPASSEPPAELPDGAEMAHEILRQIGFLEDPEHPGTWLLDGAGDEFFPQPGVEVQRHPPEIDLRAVTAGSADLSEGQAAALTDLAPCGGEASLADGTPYRMVCSQQRPMPPGEVVILATTHAGGFPTDIPATAQWSWSVFSNPDDDLATGFSSTLPDNYLIGADIFHEVLAFQGSDGSFRFYILATRMADPPRPDTGQRQGNLVTNARAIWFHEAGMFLWIIPAADFGSNWDVGAFTTTDRGHNSPETLAADALGDPSDADWPRYRDVSPFVIRDQPAG